MPKIKFIYFDIGGVLLDWYDSFKTATEEFNIPFKEFNKLWLDEKMVDDMTRGKITPQDLWNKAITKFKLKDAETFNFVESWMQDYKPRLEVHKLVYELEPRYKIGLISNLYKGMMPRLVELGIIPNISYSAIVLSYETGLRKTEKEIFEIATEKAMVKPGEIFLIDDRIDFIQGAEDLGWRTFLFDPNNVKKSVANIIRIFKI